MIFTLFSVLAYSNSGFSAIVLLVRLLSMCCTCHTLLKPQLSVNIKLMAHKASSRHFLSIFQANACTIAVFL